MLPYEWSILQYDNNIVLASNLLIFVYSKAAADEDLAQHIENSIDR